MNKGKVFSSYEREWVVFEKGAGYKLLVIIQDVHMAAISLSYEVREGVPFIPYVYEGKTSKETYENYLHVLGKMCLKKGDSKYFSSPNFSEHCVNGQPGAWSSKMWETFGVASLKKVRELL